jgi:hypothetical protein
MNENRRVTPRFSVSLYVERQDLVESPTFIRNLSATGFLVRGPVLAGQGGVFRATFRVHPKTGEARVTTRGRVMHCRVEGNDAEFGIKIEEFGSPEEERAYQEYVLELKIRDRKARGAELVTPPPPP